MKKLLFGLPAAAVVVLLSLLLGGCEKDIETISPEGTYADNETGVESRNNNCAVPDSLQEQHNRKYIKFVYRGLPDQKYTYGAPIWEKSLRKTDPNDPTLQHQIIPLADTATATLLSYLLVQQKGISSQVVFIRKDSLQHFFDANGINLVADEFNGYFEYLVNCYANNGGVLDFRDPCGGSDPDCPPMGGGSSFWESIANFFNNIIDWLGGGSGVGSGSGEPGGTNPINGLPGSTIYNVPTYGGGSSGGSHGSNGGGGDPQNEICNSSSNTEDPSQGLEVTDLDGIIEKWLAFGETFGVNDDMVFDLMNNIPLLPSCYSAASEGFSSCVLQSIGCYYRSNLAVQTLGLTPIHILNILADCESSILESACIDDHPVVQFLLEQQGEVQFSEEEIDRLLENPVLFQEISSFLSQHLVEGASESDKNLAIAITRAYDDIYAEFGSTTLDLGDGPSDPIRDIVIDMLLETVKELVADFVPGGTLATIGPELFNNLQGGQWMDAMFNAVDIVLNEADAFFPAAKMGSFAYGAFVKGKHLKKAFEAFKKAKSLGEGFLLNLYDVFRNKLNWSISKVRDNFQWLGGVNAKVDDASGSDFFEKMKEAFGVSVSSFSGINGQPIFKILELPYEPSQALYMELYPEANSGWNWTIEISKGPKNAVTYTQLVSKFKIRFDF